MAGYAVWPLRFSAQPLAMIDFATTLGLRLVEQGDDGSFATFAGASGLLGVHDAGSAAAGPTSTRTVLNFVTTDVEAAARELADQGLQTRVWAEDYGRQGSVRSPSGLLVGLNEDPGRIVIAEFGDQAVAASMNVVALSQVADPEREAAFFACFGFRAIESGPGYLPLTAGTGTGVLGLRRAGEGTGRGRDLDRLDAPYEVELAVEASEPFDALAARMLTAGHRAEIVQDETGSWIAVTDPDGAVLEVRPTR